MKSAGVKPWRLPRRAPYRAPGRREGKWLDLPAELGEKERFTFAQEEELLYAEAVVLRELVAELAIERLRLLKGGKFFVGNEKTVVALEEVCEDETLVTSRQEIARLEALESID